MAPPSSKTADPWIRLFDVSEPSLHNKGYTVYKVVSTVFPRNCPEAATQLIAWKRFSDFKKLYRGLSALHASLHLKGTFPRFPKDKVFGRFQADVIEERRQSALLLLEFVAKFPPLFTSQQFVKFFEGCKRNALTDDEASRVSDEPLLQPQLLYDRPSQQQQQSSPNSSGDCAGQMLGGVWQYCRASDDLSLGSTDESDDPPSTTHDTPSSPRPVQSSPVHSTTIATTTTAAISADDMALFDPLRATPASLGTSTAVDNSWLLSALAHCGQSPTPATLTSPPHSPATGITDTSSAFDFPPAFADLDDDGSGDGGEEEASVAASRLRSEVHRLLESTSVAASSGTDPALRAATPLHLQETWTTGPAGDEWNGEPPGSDYLLSTARLLTSAQEAEAGGQFEQAFNLYKSVVGTLLSGVQEDLDPMRREAVRRKTAQYLQRAEHLYEKHLAGREAADQVRWAVTQQQKSQLESESQIKLLKSPPSELGRYKVLGVIGKVMLVLDSFTDTPLAIKVLPKSAKTGVFMSPWVVPSNVPWMVRLVRFHETEESIFLVLQHAVGGKLWHYIASYLQGCAGGAAGIGGPFSGAADSRFDQSATTNVYTGRKLMEHVQSGAANTTTTTCSSGRAVEQRQECANSYVRLFTDSGAACRSRGRTSLAECAYVSARFQVNRTGDGSEEAVVDTRRSEQLTGDGDGSMECEEPVFEGEGECEEDRHRSWTTLLADVEPHQLISNAQKLMQHVDETIRQSNGAVSSKVAMDSGSSSSVDRSPTRTAAMATEASAESPRLTQLSGRRSSELTSGKRRRPTTSEDAFPVAQGLQLDGAPQTGRRSSAGSLELKTRVRHFSSVFRRLDDTRNSSVCAGLPENCIRVWAAEIAVAISSLHDKGIICRDLKPDNVLLGERGHVMLSYFSQWPSVERAVDPLAKECHYAAPEIGGIFPVTPSCDWWSLGALMFELLTGKTLVSSHPGGFTSHTQLNIPCPLSAEAQDLLRRLLCYNSNERLDMESVKAHAFFAEINWKDLT